LISAIFYEVDLELSDLMDFEKDLTEDFSDNISFSSSPAYCCPLFFEDIILLLMGSSEKPS